MRAEQVIDMQADLLDRLRPGAPLRATARTHITLDLYPEAKFIREAGNIDAFKRIESRQEHLMDAMRNSVQNAECYRVAPDMCDVVQYSASMLEADDVVDLDLPPTQCGLVRFERAIPVRDARGTTMHIHWLLWGPTQVDYTSALGVETSITGIGLYSFNDLDEPDEVALAIAEDIGGLAQMRRIVGRWNLVSSDILIPGRSVGDDLIAPREELTEAMLANEGVQALPYTNIKRYMHALWLLLNQTIADVRPEHLRNHVGKMAARKNLPGRVTVVQLRRTDHAGEELGGSSIQWSHRWIVRGHWRWQVYGPGRTERRRIWISPFIKGPAGKPIIANPKVYDMRR